MASSSFHASLRWLHRWVGLTVGLIFAVVSVSGSLLLFQPQFFDWAHGHLMPASARLQPVGSLDTWVANAKTATPGLVPIAIWPPHADHNVSDVGMIIMAGRPPGGLGNMGFAGVLLAPATGEVLGVIDVDRSPAYAPLFLHRDLWTGAVGRVVSGVMAIGTLFLLVAGLYLWWPPRASLLARKLSPRPWWTLTQASRLHDWVGVWSLVVLLVLVGTGLHLVQPHWVEPAIDALPGAPEPDLSASACSGPMGFDKAVARARALAPSSAFVRMNPTGGKPGEWEIGLRPADSSAPQGESHIVADMTCGRVFLETSPDNRRPREATDLWLSGLHDGTSFGRTGEILVSLAGLMPLVLAWSGVRMWWRKRRPARAADRLTRAA